MPVIIQGGQAVASHFIALSQGADPITQSFALFFGESLKEVAKQIHQPNIDTQATYDSISAGPDPGGPPEVFSLGPGVYGIDVGPFTEYSVFQEFGFIHYLSGEFIQNPFMMPAADVIEPLFTDAFIQLAEVADDRRFFVGPAAQSKASATLNSMRNFLYSYSKFAGDLRIIGIGGLSRSRGLALRGAALLGDTDAAMKGAIGTRITRRYVGRFAAAGISTSISASLTGPSSSFVGASGRIYNRIRGRVFGRSLRGL